VRVLYLDCFAGVSGDMAVGALLALGAPIEGLREALAPLPLGGYRLATRHLERSGIRATRFDVLIDHEQGQEHGHDRHGHGHGHHHRAYRDIRRMLEQAGLAPGVRDRALAVFARLAEAEGRVHGVAPDDVTFHEVGAVDSVVDVVGVAFGLDWLGVERLAAAPLPVGRGFVPSRHGPLPLPAPAVLELCRGLPVVAAPVDAELVTPTGAAIVAALAAPGDVGPFPAMTVEGVGYGAGAREFAEVPNLLRAVAGRRAAGAAGRGRERAVVVETNLDDMNPQLFEPLVARLAAAGALDVTLVPVQMKKGRPGVTVQVLCRPGEVAAAVEALFAESTALGVRTYEVERSVLRRAVRSVATAYGEVAVKLGGDGAVVRNVQPEYEACRRVAEARGVPVKAVHAAAVAAAQAAWPVGSPFPEEGEPRAGGDAGATPGGDER
jgi:pyridinium-3,5-bisthiocarboxylic acid mononucleotide nickel chelatase